MFIDANAAFAQINGGKGPPLVAFLAGVFSDRTWLLGQGFLAANCSRLSFGRLTEERRFGALSNWGGRVWTRVDNAKAERGVFNGTGDQRIRSS